MFRWFRRTFLGLTPAEKKVKKLKSGSTFKYKGKGYRVRGNGRAYAIDGDHDDFLELLFLLDIAADGVLDFDFGWSPHVYVDETAHITPETMDAVAAQMQTPAEEDTVDEPVQEEPKAEIESKDEFQLEQEIERPSIEPYVPDPEPVKSFYSPPPEPVYAPDPEPSRSYSSGSYDTGGSSSSYDSGGSSDCGGGDCGGCD